MRRLSTGAARSVPLSLVEGQGLDRARHPDGSEQPSASALSRITVLPVSIARAASAGVGEAAALFQADGIVTAIEAVHASGVDRRLLESTRADVVLLDARQVRPTLTYRAIARLRGAGWSGGIVLLLDAADLPIVPVASTIGATDFVLATASREEVEARLRREGSRKKRPAARHSGAGIADASGIQLHWRTHHVSFEGTRISLTLRELQMLAVFLEHTGDIVTPNDLARLAWGQSKRSGGALATTYVCSLRKKLAWFGGRFGIQTVRAVGYRFVV
jgi:DNA-binding response OmpR family regulator